MLWAARKGAVLSYRRSTFGQCQEPQVRVQRKARQIGNRAVCRAFADMTVKCLRGISRAFAGQDQLMHFLPTYLSGHSEVLLLELDII